MLAMFNGVDLPTGNERASELLKRINTLWEDNAWLAGETHQTRHMKVSVHAQSKIIKLVLNDPDSVEEVLNNEICIHQFVEWVLQGEEEVDC